MPKGGGCRAVKAAENQKREEDSEIKKNCQPALSSQGKSIQNAEHGDTFFAKKRAQAANAKAAKAAKEAEAKAGKEAKAKQAEEDERYRRSLAICRSNPATPIKMNVAEFKALVRRGDSLTDYEADIARTYSFGGYSSVEDGRMAYGAGPIKL